MRREALAALSVLLLTTACSSKPGQLAPGRADTGQAITVLVENNSSTNTTVGFSWQEDVPISLGRVDPGGRQAWPVVWQDLPFRLSVNREGFRQAFTQSLRPAANDTVDLVLAEDGAIRALIRE